MKKKLFWIGIYIAALAACVLAIYIVPSVAGLLESTYIVEHGNVELAEDVDGYIVRNEAVYVAGKDGKVTQVADNGELVRVGTKIVDIAGEGNEEKSKTYEQIITSLGDMAVVTDTGASQGTGFVVYSVDGAEGRLNYDGLEKLKKSELKEYTAGRLVDTAKGKCAKGEPVFKITANGDWWIVFYVDNDDAKRYSEDSNVKITVGDETVNAYVDSVKKGKKETRVVLCCSVMVKDYMTMRTAKVKVTVASAEGLVIQNKSIVERDGHKGVLIKNKHGKNVFVRVGVKADDGERSAVCEDIFMDEDGNYVETIDVYDEVISSPSKSEVENAEKR